jgi:hypothetical protein
MFPPDTAAEEPSMSNGVQQTGNRVPYVLRFAKKGQFCVNYPRSPRPDR